MNAQLSLGRGLPYLDWYGMVPRPWPLPLPGPTPWGRGPMHQTVLA